MKQYDEQSIREILRVMDSDILAVVAIDTATDEFQVIHTDGAYRDFGDRYQGTDFFGKWRKVGLSLVYGPDRIRMGHEIEKGYLLNSLNKEETYITVCRFDSGNGPFYARIKVKKDVIYPETMIMSIRNIDREVKKERENLELAEALELMRKKRFMSQSHPHFLFNVLSSIREIVLTDPGYGADVLYDFTVYLRAGIRAMANDELIELEKELETVRAYVNIEKMRFGEKLDVIFEIEDKDCMIVPFAVQPVVENAIRHGVYESEKEKCTVTVKAYDNGLDHVITVEDDGTGFDAAETCERIRKGEKDSTGISNLRYRLENMMDAKLDIVSTPGKGTQVTITIPKR